jgi:two-component system nitrogen regulation response regulator GlnG
MERRQITRENQILRQEVKQKWQLKNVIGKSPAMRVIFDLVGRVAGSTANVLVTGESGSGKEVIARAIHDFSDRRSQPFVVAQAADLGGVDGIATLVAKARGGTLLVDEVADFDEDGQARLVRMLDVADDHAPRILATSQADLAQKVEEGRLRKDLFYRLGGVSFNVPPLRERVEDITLLADHFMARAEREMGMTRRVSQPARNILRAFAWPGNVRQLRNLMDWLLIMTPGDSGAPIRAEALPPDPAHAEWLHGRIVEAGQARGGVEEAGRARAVYRLDRFGAALGTAEPVAPFEPGVFAGR